MSPETAEALRVAERDLIGEAVAASWHVADDHPLRVAAVAWLRVQRQIDAERVEEILARTAAREAVAAALDGRVV